MEYFNSKEGINYRSARDLHLPNEFRDYFSVAVDKTEIIDFKF